MSTRVVYFPPTHLVLAMSGLLVSPTRDPCMDPFLSIDLGRRSSGLLFAPCLLELYLTKIYLDGQWRWRFDSLSSSDG